MNDWPQLILQVIRLKPGEGRDVELDLPSGRFMWGRTDLHFRLLAKPADGADLVFNKAEPGERIEPVGAGDSLEYKLADGLSVIWQPARREILSFRAGQGAAAGTTDLGVTHLLCLGNAHFVGFRVVVQVG